MDKPQQKISHLFVTSFAVMIAVFIATQFAITQYYYYPGLNSSRYEIDALNLQRVENVFASDFAVFNLYVNDNAAWDDAKQALLTRDTEFFEEAILYPQTMQDMGAEAAYIVDLDSKVLTQYNTLDDNLLSGLTGKYQQRLFASQQNKKHHGFLMLDEQVYFYSSSAVTQSDEQGDLVGTFTMLKRIGGQQIREYSEISAVNLSLVLQPQTLASTAQRMETQNSYIMAYHLEHQVHIELRDIDGNRLTALTFPTFDNTIETTDRLVLQIVPGLGAVLVGVLVMLPIRRKIIRPIQDISNHLASLLQQNTNFTLLKVNNPTEIGIMAKHINLLLQFVNSQRSVLEQRYSDLNIKSQIDALTQVYNRLYLEEQGLKLWQNAILSQNYLSVLMVDVDHFKAYNDHYGHQQGDLALKSVAQTLKSTLRGSTDVVARYGGEEFAIMLPNTNSNSCEVVANNLLQAITNLAMVHEYSDTANVITISIGGATWETGQESTPEQMLKDADQALYKAKKDGRARYVHWQNVK